MKRIWKITFCLLSSIIIITMSVTAQAANLPQSLNKNTKWSLVKIMGSNKKFYKRIVLHENDDRVGGKDNKVGASYGTAMQFFDIGSDGSVYFSSYDENYNLWIDRIKDGVRESMKLNRFGHGQGFAVDSKQYAYIGSLATKITKENVKCTSNAGISYFKFKNNATMNIATGITYILPTEPIKNYNNININILNKGIQPILDEDNGLFGVVIGSKEVRVYNLNEVKAVKSQKGTIKNLPTDLYSSKEISLTVADLSSIKPIASINLKNLKYNNTVINIKEGQAIQGIALYGNKIYIYKSTLTGNAGNTSGYNSGTIVVYDYNKKQIVETTSTDIKLISQNVTTENYDKNSSLNKAFNIERFNPKASNAYKPPFEGQGIQVRKGKVYVGIYSKVEKIVDKEKRICKICSILATN